MFIPDATCDINWKIFRTKLHYFLCSKNQEEKTIINVLFNSSSKKLISTFSKKNNLMSQSLFFKVNGLCVEVYVLLVST